MISALAFVPVANIIADFNSLAAHCGLAEQPVLDYFENTYIGQPQRGRRNDPIIYGTLIHELLEGCRGQKMPLKDRITSLIEACASSIQASGNISMP